MKIIGTKKELAFIKELIMGSNCDCKNCIYEQGCADEEGELCGEYILKNIVFEDSEETRNNMKIFRVMVCGSRTFSDYVLLEKRVIGALKARGITRAEYNIIIVSGEAKGADELGERFASKFGLKVEPYPALWNDLTKKPCKIKTNRYGKKYNCLAGLNRNKDMVEVSDLVIMFHDGVSKGTFDDLRLCKEMKKDFEYILFK